MTNPTETPTERLRRLPWRTPSGKPAYLPADAAGSLLALMADTAEEAILKRCENVLTLATGHAGEMAQRLSESLADAVDIARMRGERL